MQSRPSQIGHYGPTRASEHNVAAIPRFKSEDLLGNSQQVVIVHGGQFYRLRATRSGKLILNK